MQAVVDIVGSFDCNEKNELVNFMCAIYFHYILDFYFEDRGELIDPTDSFISRLWTVYKFVDKVLPLVSQCSNILNDSVEMLLPRLLECSDLNVKMEGMKQQGLEK